MGLRCFFSIIFLHAKGSAFPPDLAPAGDGRSALASRLGRGRTRARADWGCCIKSSLLLNCCLYFAFSWKLSKKRPTAQALPGFEGGFKACAPAHPLSPSLPKGRNVKARALPSHHNRAQGTAELRHMYPLKRNHGEPYFLLKKVKICLCLVPG